MVMKKSNESAAIDIVEIQTNTIKVNIIGTSPLIPHAVSFKAAGQLLFPPPKKNAAEKASSMKHEPYQEFVDAAYSYVDTDNTPTRLYMPAGAFHGCMAAVAIDMAGARKSQIGRLTSVPGLKIPLFGIPQIYSTIVRSSDMARTPDVRTLPILPEWTASIFVEYVDSLIKEQSIINLLVAAGKIIGVGDGRPEKGKLTFGQFRICNDDDPDFIRICAAGQRAAQDAALESPQPYDLETKRLLEWFDAERGRRAAAPTTSPKKRKGKGNIESVVISTDGANGKDQREAT